MRVLVTGASGFIGSATVPELLQRGHTVAGLTRQDPYLLPAGVTWIQGDMRDPPWEKIKDFAPDTCLHCAWIATPGTYLDSPENKDWVTWSIGFLENLARIGVSRIVGLGTCIEYEMTGRPLREDTPLRPLAIYSECKVALQQLLKRSGALDGVELTWARIFYPYGAGEHARRLSSQLIAKFSRGEHLTLNTPHSTKDYIHIYDVAGALATICGSTFQGDINVGTGEGISVECLARMLATQLGRPDLVQVSSQVASNSDPYSHVVACADKLKALGWQPKVTLEQGLQALARKVLSWK